MKSTLVSSVLVCIIMVSSGMATAADDVREFPSCKYCGMNREMFSQTRMLVEYDDNTKAGFCSLHCAAVDMAISIDKGIKALWVGDYQSRELIGAYTAHWIIGAEIPGVMTKRSKVAFANREDALKFQKEKNGTVVEFEQAIKAAYEDMYADTQMIREKRKMKKMQQEQQHVH